MTLRLKICEATRWASEFTSLLLCAVFVIGPSSSFQRCTRLADRTFIPLCNVAFGVIRDRVVPAASPAMSALPPKAEVR
jgi:hypothetical protein